MYVVQTAMESTRTLTRGKKWGGARCCSRYLNATIARFFLSISGEYETAAVWLRCQWQPTYYVGQNFIKTATTDSETNCTHTRQIRHVLNAWYPIMCHGKHIRDSRE